MVFTDLLWTPGAQNFPGFVGKIYVGASADILTPPILSAVGALDTTATAMVMKTGKRFYEWYVTDETAGLLSKMIGQRDAKGVQSDFDVAIPGDYKSIAEQKRLWLNTPIIVGMKDTDGNARLMGLVNLDPTGTVLSATDIPAFIEKFDGGSGVKRTDERGYKINMSWKAPHDPIFYKGTGGLDALLTPGP